MSRPYIPVQAKRDVLNDYRWRLHEQRDTSEAMWASRAFYASWLAQYLAQTGEIPQDELDRYRAADMYLHRIWRRRAQRRERVTDRDDAVAA
jgi:hypothetical protein